MIKKVLGKSMTVLSEFPVRLWGISLLCSVVRLLVVLTGILVPIISIPISLTIATGMSVIYLNGYNGIVPTASQLFDGFKKENAQRVIGGSCWLALWQFIWFFIPVVNVIKLLQYSFTPYILMQRPDVSPTDALKVSIQETRGYKAPLFGAMLIVVVIEAVITGLLKALATLPSVGIIFNVLLVLFGIIVNLFVPLLMGIIRAGFYDEAQKAKTLAE
ncbi:MAG: hypothetical protein LUG52_00780 [Clostridia bacterium]|nr:hypothetical protein [Clostridia bacterium]